VIFVDDGSRDSSQQLVVQYKKVINIRHEMNQGLSVARNTGIAAAKGELWRSRIPIAGPMRTGCITLSLT